jgi:hypothetical protein
MKALVFDGRLSYRNDYPVPTPAPGEVLVRVHRAGICNTDIEITKGYMNYRGVLGHEFVGSLPNGSRIVGEINAADLTRVDHPTELLQDLGLTPSEDTRGARRRQGSITKAGNTQACRVLVEGAWASRDPGTVSRHLHRRLEHQSPVLPAISWKAHVRRCTR